jgi:hypothetical protein
VSDGTAGAPRVALVIPPWFDAASPQHRAERALATELASCLRCRYDVDEVHDLAALEGHAFALCILDRALAARCAERVPTRLVGSDTLYFDASKWRLAFQLPRLDGGAPEAPPPGHAPDTTAIYVDHFVSPDDAARLGARLRQRHPGARVFVSRHLSSPARAALEQALSSTVSDVVSRADLTEGVDHLLSNDPATLALVRAPAHRTLVSTELSFHDATQLAWSRPDLVLYKGEESDPVRLATLLLSSGAAAAGAREYVRPLISVVVPVYDRDQEIHRLAESLLVQRYPNLEAVFVTNGSPTGTLTAVRDAAARLRAAGLDVQTLSFARAFGSATVPRDIGCYAARGAFLCLLDSDDYLEPGFFDQLLDAPLSDAVIYSPKRIYRDAGRQMGGDFTFDRVLDGIGDVSDGLYPLLLALGNVFQNSGMIVSRDAFVRAGGIDHGLRYCEDYYLWLRLARAGSSTKEHAGRVSITFHPGNNELSVGDPEWFFRARAAADRDQVL